MKYIYNKPMESGRLGQVGHFAPLPGQILKEEWDFELDHAPIPHQYRVAYLVKENPAKHQPVEKHASIFSSSNIKV